MAAASQARGPVRGRPYLTRYDLLLLILHQTTADKRWVGIKLACVVYPVRGLLKSQLTQ
jgi:hypothetical protein